MRSMTWTERTCRVGGFALSSLVTRVTEAVADLEAVVAAEAEVTGAATEVVIEGLEATHLVPGPTTDW